MRRVRKETKAHQPPSACDTQVIAPLDDGTVMLSAIQALIPLGLKALEEALQHEVASLAGARYAHHDGAAGVVSDESPHVPTDGSTPASASRSV